MFFSKKILTYVLAATTIVALIMLPVSAEGIASENQSITQYRYREKQYITSETELENPWVLHRTSTEYEHGDLYPVYRDAENELDSEKYCVHMQYPVCKYRHPTNSKSVYVRTTNHSYYYTSGDIKYFHYGDYICYQCCSKTEYTLYHYYSWSEWSEWSETEVTETDNRQVETREIYTVSYDANGGSSAPELQVKLRDENLCLSDVVPVRDCYVFMGWSTTPNGTIEYDAGAVYSANASVTLYAVWCEDYADANVIDSGVCGDDLEWTLYDNGMILISGTGPMYDWSDWSEVPWNLYRYQIETVRIEEGCTTVGSCAFAATTTSTSPTSTITDVALPSTLTAIHYRAFDGCVGITEITIPNNVEVIGGYAFDDCNRLKTVSFGENLKTIGSYAFYGCGSLASVELNANLETIGWYAFACCDLVKCVEIQENVKSMGIGPFSSCDKLQEFKVHPDNPYFRNDANGVLYDTVNHILVQYPLDNESETYVVGDSTVEIARDAFSGCNYLEEVYLPESVRLIRSYNFHDYGDGSAKPSILHYAGTEDEWWDIDVEEYNSQTNRWPLGVIFGKFTVKFDGNSNNHTGNVPTQKKNRGVDLAIPTQVFTRWGYTFAGWATTSDGDVEYLPGDIYSKDEAVILYAVWQANTYEIIYDANGGSGAPAQQSKIFGENITLSSGIPARDGYAFLGWSTTSSGEVEYTEGSIYAEDESVVLFAVWAKEYTIFFDANGGSNAPEFQNKTHDEDMIITSKKPTLEGAEFLGWSLTSNGSVQYEAGSVYSENSDMILYAVWKQYTYTITYYGYGCTNAPAQQIKTYNIPVTLSEQIPERQWHTFLGWAIKEDGDVVYNSGDTYSENSDITLYPVWKRLSDEEIIIASGYDSNALYDPNSSLWWELSRAGTLTLTGYGTMRDFQSISNAPWKTYREKIKKVVICSGISSIGDDAFSACVNLTEVIIPDSVVTIGDDAFYYTALTELAISDSVTTVGSAFSYCDDMVAIYIGKNVKNFPYSALNGCDNLLSIQVSENNPYFSNDAAGALLNKNQTALIRVPGGIEGQYIVPNSATRIGTSAFDGCANLLTVIIPKSVTTIGTSAFYGCDNLKSVYYCGTESEWASIQINSANTALSNAIRYYHDVKEEIIQSSPTCTIDGEKNGVCSICGETVVSSIPATGAHNYSQVITPVTCIADGYTTHSCKDCGDSYIDSYIEATGHTYGSWVKVNDEIHKRTCACGESETEAHSWDGGEITKQSSHTTYGERTYTCEGCSATKTEQIKKTAQHSYGDWVKVDDKNHSRTCICGETETKTHTEILISAVEPTCTKDGLTQGSYCGICGEVLVEQEMIPAAHSLMTDAATPATCTAAGLTEGRHCSVCGDVMSAQMVVPALGHDIINHPGKVPTAESAGWTDYQTCSRCDYTTYKDLPKVEVVQKPLLGRFSLEVVKSIIVNGEQVDICRWVWTPIKEE